MTKLKLVLLSLLMSTQITGWSQTIFKSVEEVWKYADDHSVAIQVARMEADKSMYAKKQSFGTFLPQVSASGTFTDNTSLTTTLLPGVILGKPDGVYIPVQFGQKYIYAGGIGAQMDLLNLQTWFNYRTARIGEQISKDSLATTRKSIYQQIASQYYSLLLMQEAAKLSGQSELIADSAYNSVNHKFTEGTVNKASVDVAKINLNRAQQTNITSQYQVLTAINNLKALLNMSLTDSLLVTGTLQTAIMDAYEKEFAEDPSIKLAYHQVQQSIEAYKAGNSNFVPSLTALYSTSTQQNDNKFEPFQNGPSWYPATYWSLRASWTIFNGGSRYYQSKRNKVSVDERRLQYENTQKQSAINDENIRLSYRKTAALLANAEEVMHLSFDNYMHIADRYESGLNSIDDRLNAFTDYITYQNQYLNSLSDMLVQLYQIKIRQQSF